MSLAQRHVLPQNRDGPDFSRRDPYSRLSGPLERRRRFHRYTPGESMSFQNTTERCSTRAARHTQRQEHDRRNIRVPWDRWPGGSLCRGGDQHKVPVARWPPYRRQKGRSDLKGRAAATRHAPARLRHTVDNMEFLSGQDMPMSRLTQPKVEAEVAFVIAWRRFAW